MNLEQALKAVTARGRPVLRKLSGDNGWGCDVWYTYGTGRYGHGEGPLEALLSVLEVMEKDV